MKVEEIMAYVGYQEEGYLWAEYNKFTELVFGIYIIDNLNKITKIL